jgi:hypothetical protein
MSGGNSGFMNEKANQMKERVAPGIWIDQNGDLHFSIPELLDLYDLPHTKENFDRMKQVCAQVVRQRHPKAIIKYRDKNHEEKI